MIPEALRLGLPEAVEVAVFVGRDGFVALGEHEYGLGLFAGREGLLLEALLSLKHYELDVMSIEHGVFDGADGHGDL